MVSCRECRVAVERVAGAARRRISQVAKIARRQVEADPGRQIAQPDIAAEQQHEEIPHLRIHQRGAALEFGPPGLGTAERFGGDLEAVEALKNQSSSALYEARAGQPCKLFFEAVTQVRVDRFEVEIDVGHAGVSGLILATRAPARSWYAAISLRQFS